MADEQTPASEPAKKLAATIVHRANQSVRDNLGVNAEFKPIGLETLIDIYLNAARREARRESAEHIAELERTFDLRWKADTRAITRWRSEAPGRELRQPDHADMVVWLLDKLESAGVQF